MRNILILFSGLIAPVTLLITTYIAIQQKRTNDLKVRLDLYDSQHLQSRFSYLQCDYFFAFDMGEISDVLQTI